MAERGEGAASFGGSFICSSPTTQLANTRNRNPSLVGTEGAGTVSTPLPLRKRKFVIADLVSGKPYHSDSSEYSINCNATTVASVPANSFANTFTSDPSLSRRRSTNSHIVGIKAQQDHKIVLNENTNLPNPKRQRRNSNPDRSESSIVSVNLASQSSSSTSLKKTQNLRRSGRTSLPLGFYCEKSTRFVVQLIQTHTSGAEDINNINLTREKFNSEAECTKQKALQPSSNSEEYFDDRNAYYSVSECRYNNFKGEHIKTDCTSSSTDLLYPSGNFSSLNLDSSKKKSFKSQGLFTAAVAESMASASGPSGTNVQTKSKKVISAESEVASASSAKSLSNSTDTEISPRSTGIFKSYPLRNRLRLSDSGSSYSNTSSPNPNRNSIGSGPELQQPSLSHYPLSASQSLPASPSSSGVAFLADTFRRLRESRRASQEHRQSSSQLSVSVFGKRGNGHSKEKPFATSWKRNHVNRKSPLSLKANGRGKLNNTGSCASSSSQHSSRGCTKVGLGGNLGMSGPNGGQGSTSVASTSNTSSQACSGFMSAQSGMIGTPISIPPPLSLAGVLPPLPSAAPNLLSNPTYSLDGMSSATSLGGATSGSSVASSFNAGSGLTSIVGSIPTDSESEENEMGRLEALLASRGLPPNLFGALGPRMQHILHRSVSSSISSKAQQLLVGLQANGDESVQLQAVIEMCQLLVMGNEDTLTGFPIKQVTPALINLLSMEHNFDMMNHACRALTYMMEALPRSSSVVVEAVPIFLEKLKVIQCMDVAEQSLTALDMLSRKHYKSILHAHGVSACLMYIDFFSSTAQRAALSVTANCCQNLSADEFHFIVDSLPLLSSRLTSQGDKKCMESVCLAYSLLVQSFQNDPNKLQEIAGHNLLPNLQQLLAISPPVFNSSTFIMVILMLSLMCSNCPELAVQLLKNNIAQTLCFLLTNSTDPPGDQVELVPRSPQELYEITCLIGELMPALPSDGMFSIDGVLKKTPHTIKDGVIWQWQDDRATWQNYSPSESRTIELAYQLGDDDISLCVQGRAYTLDFNSMQQINDNTGMMRAVQRKILPLGSNPNVQGLNEIIDARAKCLEEDLQMATTLIKTLFSMLYEVYSSSAGPAVRHKCLKAMLRMIHFSNPVLLREVLPNQAVSSQLATMLSSSDLKIIVGALQMTRLLLQKLPDIFSIYFRREGVMHEVKRLCNPDTILGGSVHSSKSETLGNNARLDPKISITDSPLLSIRNRQTSFGTNCEAVSALEEEKLHSPSQLRLSDVLKKKRIKTPARMTTGGAAPRRKRQDEATRTSSFGEMLMKNTGLCNNRESWGRRNKFPSLSSNGSVSSGKMASSLFASLNPARWGRCNSMSSSSQIHDSVKSNSAIPALTEISQIVSESDISPFEVIHSGLVHVLLAYLTVVEAAMENVLSIPIYQQINGESVIGEGLDGIQGSARSLSPVVISIPRETRIRNFLNVFLGCPTNPLNQDGISVARVSLFSALVAKLNGCVNHLEQFPVKVHDLPGSTVASSGRGGSTSAIKFFNTHQLKCHLQRHPDCTQLRQWRGGPVKVDPLALVQAIERYLVIRGYARLQDDDDDNSDDDNSDDDIDDTLASVTVNQSSSSHKLQFLINDTVLPYNMTVYQAIRQFSSGPSDAGSSEVDTDSETPISQSSIWLQTHTIYYRSVQDQEPAKSGRRGKGVSKISPKKKADQNISGGSILYGSSSILDQYLLTGLPRSVTVRDPSAEALALLRVLHALNQHYGVLYPPTKYSSPLPTSDFTNLKLTAKANRQLQDPLVIMTGNLPSWLPQIAYACPFLFPFETRQLLFYTVSFDRDRALQRLIDSTPELNSSDLSERVTPRFERRKRTVSRDDILKQAETVINDLATSRAMLEIQYDNEVGTGLGPTLEFYALVSKELQLADLDLWRGEIISVEEGKTEVKYIDNRSGLYPQPVPRGMKSAHITKLKAKFRFLGKFIAKAVMDSRMNKLDSLSVNGCSLEDLCLNFTLPGYPNIDMRKGGSDISVNINNVDQFLQLVVNWLLRDGVWRQMEALREGFEAVFPLAQLQIFYPEELEQLFCGSTASSQWDIKQLAECCRPDHGYTHNSKAVKFLLEILSEYTPEQQRLFLQFVTGSPRLPVGGFRSLTPPLTIVRKTFEAEENPDGFLPSVMTCVNYLKLPDYSSKDIMRAKLELAAKEGQHSFHLS